MQGCFSAKLHLCVFTHQVFLLVWLSQCYKESTTVLVRNQPPAAGLSLTRGSLQLLHALHETTNWGSANYISQLYLIRDFQPRCVWGMKGTMSPCSKKTVVRDTGHCWHQGGGHKSESRGRALAFSSGMRLLQKRLGWGKISTVGVAANLSEKAKSALHHLQEEQGEFKWVRLFWLCPRHRRTGTLGRSESTPRSEPRHLSPCFL